MILNIYNIVDIANNIIISNVSEEISTESFESTGSFLPNQPRSIAMERERHDAPRESIMDKA